MYKFLLILLLFISSPAWATDLIWKDVSTDQNLTTTEKTKIGGVQQNYLSPSSGKSYYVSHIGAGATGNKSLVISTLPCANGGVLEFFADATGATSVARGVVYYCPTGSGATTALGCAKVLTDINDVQIGADEYDFTGDPGLITSDPDGNGLSDNRAWVTDIKNPLIFVTWSVSPGTGVTSIWKYTCPSR